MNEQYISFHKEYNGLCIISFEMERRKNEEKQTPCAIPYKQA